MRLMQVQEPILSIEVNKVTELDKKETSSGIADLTLKNSSLLKNLPDPISKTLLLDKAFSLSPQPHYPIPQGWKMAHPADITPLVRGVIVACIRAGWGQTKTIQEIFGIIKSGNNPNYDLAREVFQKISNSIN